MGTYFLSHLHALGGGVVGYIVPFLFVLSLGRVFPRIGHFLMARWCGVRILVFSIGFGPELIGFQRPPRHPMEDRGHSARRLRQVLRRRECRQRCPMRRACGMSDARPRAELLRSSRCISARPSWWPGRWQISSWLSSFSPDLHVLRQADHERRGWTRPGRQRGRYRRLSSPATWSSASTAARSTTSSRCSASSATAPASHFRSSWSTATASRSSLKATPALKEVKDNFGKVHRDRHTRHQPVDVASRI